MKRTGRGMFCLVAAVTAAALADPALEAASNAGWFGPGRFTDSSTLDVLPALTIALVLGLAYVFVQARRRLLRCLPPTHWLHETVAPCSARDYLATNRETLAGTFATQLVVLYVMETFEQIVIAGHPLGGTIWLGAPVAIALLVHALACALVSFALGRALEALTHAAVAIAIAFVALVLAYAPTLPSDPRRRDHRPARRTNPLAFRFGLRAPPLSGT